MNGTDISLQLAFLGVAIMTFILPSYIPSLFQKLHDRVNPKNESNFGKAVIAFSAGAVAQILVIWIGNIVSDSANFFLVTHVIAGVIFGGGAWVAAQFMPKNTSESGTS